MKLRLRGNSLRIRLGRTEAARLAAGTAVEDATQLGPGSGARFGCRLVTGPVPEITSDFKGGTLTVSIPTAAATDWHRGDEVGLQAETAWGLRIAVEKDFRCLEPQPREDEADAFERPADHRPASCFPDAN